MCTIEFLSDIFETRHSTFCPNKVPTSAMYNRQRDILHAEKYPILVCTTEIRDKIIAFDIV